MLKFSYRNILITLITLVAYQSCYATPLSERESVKQFIDVMSKTHKFDKDNLQHMFSTIEPSQEIIKHISKPFESVTWDKYRQHFITKKRIEDGVKFWNKYKTTINKAEEKFGVSSSIIVSIIGVESFYGNYTGNYPVLQSLATLAFDYPPRSAFFKQELEHFLLLTRMQKLNPAKIMGSYAGAIGAPQFISSSYRNFAIDFDSSGSIDLANNMHQSIGSVANYFKAHGWKTNSPIVYKAAISGTKYQELNIADKQNPKPNLSLATLNNYGIKPSNITINEETLASLLELENKGTKEHWIGFHNFYVITRYNHSTNYAMVVYQLSNELEKNANNI